MTTEYQAQRKTAQQTQWQQTSEDWILRSARAAQLQIAGTKQKPVLASDANVSDSKILSFIKAAGSKGVQINAFTVRLCESEASK